jgi:predicted nucleic acid-binding protein
LGNTPVSSDWLLTEFASAVSIKVRRKELSESDAKAIRSEFDLLATAGLRIVPIGRSAYQDAAKMAAQHEHGLRAGDALHLAIAQEIGAQSLATLDGVMASNAQRLKMRVEVI